MYKFEWTKSKKELDEWDSFLQATPRGHYLQVSHWLTSYTRYGFGYELLTVRDSDGNLVAGLGVVISKVAMFKGYCCPCGPVIADGYEEVLNDILEAFKQRAIEKKAIFCQVNMPLFTDPGTALIQHGLSVDTSALSALRGAYEGDKARGISSINGFRSVLIRYDQEGEPYDYVYGSFNKNTKRNVKKASKNGLELKFATTPEKVEETYHLLEHNGETQGYSVRAWEDFKDTLLGMMEKGMCMMPYCEFEGKMLGALIIFNVGKRLTYVSGGTIREERDLKVGHFLHNEMLKLSIEKGYRFYDISVGGSPGVTRFKEGFNGRHVAFYEPRYWVLSPLLFKAYDKALPYFKRHKVLVSKALKLFR
ncbi:lipid II:glycine glycyltransferase FemX [Roseivirga sp. BDSF3-8]|uniref:lipid II:glycine glycyltransferase FemX n=1 Tax=Roseivirga sp. BDSF3-8 TaxID=3241598 RepID=UPI0035327182